MENVRVITITVLQFPRFIFYRIGQLAPDFFKDRTILPTIAENRRSAPLVHPVNKDNTPNVIIEGTNEIVKTVIKIFIGFSNINDIRQIFIDNNRIPDYLFGNIIQDAVYLIHQHCYIPPLTNQILNRDFIRRSDIDIEN